MTTYFASAGQYGSIQTSLNVEGANWVTWCIPYFFNVPFDNSGATAWSPFNNNMQFNSITSNSTCTVAVGVGPQQNSFGSFRSDPAILRTTTGSVYAWIDPRITSVNLDTILSSVTAINGHFIAVGASPTAMPQLTVITSTDGNTWTVGTPSAPADVLLDGTLNYCAAVSMKSGLAVAVGTDTTHTAFAMTSTDNGATWSAQTPVPSANTVLRSVAHNSTVWVSVGTNFLTGVPVISTSADGITWVSRTPANALGDFRSVFAIDGMIIAVGSMSSGAVPIAESSADDGVTWTNINPTFNSSFYTAYNGAQFNAVCHNGTDWVAVGQYVDKTVALVATWDGAIWTEQRASWVRPIKALSPITMTYPSSALTIYMNDDCCHIFTSQDLGVSWYMSEENIETDQDLYSDMVMPIADADYTTMVSYDQNYNTTHGPLGPLPAIDGGAALALNTAAGQNGNWQMIDYNPTSPPATFIEPGSGAVSSGGEVIVAGGAFFVDSMGNSPGGTNIFISRDFGATWGTTGISLGIRNWGTFAFGSTASQIMYGVSGANLVSKSTDWGVTWVDLAGSPMWPDTNGEFLEGTIRIRCSADGQTVALCFVTDPASPHFAEVWLSTNGGTTWALKFTLGVIDHFLVAVDVGLSMDGVVIACLESWGIGNGVDGVTGASKVHYSTNSGASWSTKNLFSGVGSSHLVRTVNVTPDGTGIIVITGDYDMFYSLNSGTTWSANIQTLSPPAFDIPNAVFMVPFTPPPIPSPPPPPPPPPPPAGSVNYIERMADRILKDGN